MPYKHRLPAALLLAGVLAASGALLCRTAHAQQQEAPQGNSDTAKPAQPQRPHRVTIHIEVTAGEKDKPVDSASVYVRYSEARAIKADKPVEMNVKTTAEGKVRVPLVPMGKIVIQVVAPGWKPFGRSFDVTEDEQLFKIHLDKPPIKWY
ncbi:MAG TPA: carboxypeptidase-like regulatory domain-containing protein [Candidatus Acidoferrales bacterium]|nr:carboxypeptidase-like regulatory domain-containing protein [Candidatus Acidoferrales bacterium]